ncbi:MAG: hypothetical protein K0Q49_1723 [Haloplasmataceae bacterium]|nr:hypothetical protein [Haloplasmataceae bacterium]
MSNEIIKWLLEDENPAVKYRTLIEIYDVPKDGDTNTIYNSIWENKSLLKMLQKQDENGLWNSKDYGSFTPLRYLTAFAEYGLQKDKRIDGFVDYTVDSLSCEENDDPAGCCTPLVLRALIMLGYHDRNDVMELVSKFASAQHYDGGFMCKRLLDKKPNRKSCYKATIAGLLLYAECKRKNIFLHNTDKLIDYFLKRDVFYTSDKSKMFSDGRIGWRFIDNFFPVEPMRMGLPLTVSALSILGVGDHPALMKAWELLKEKTDENGKLSLEGTLVKQPCSFGKVGQENKWVTFYALLAEKYRAK